jgi:hypothetical protein
LIAKQKQGSKILWRCSLIRIIAFEKLYSSLAASIKQCCGSECERIRKFPGPDYEKNLDTIPNPKKIFGIRNQYVKDGRNCESGENDPWFSFLMSVL